MDVAKVFFADRGIALVDPVICAPVSKEVLGRCDDVGSGEKVVVAGRALQPAHHRADIGGDQLRIRGVAFVSAAPAEVLRHRDGGRESPFLPGHTDFLGRHRADLLDQVGIAHRAEADIVREDRRANDIRVAVDSVRSPHDRDTKSAVTLVDRSEVKGVGGGEPVGRGGEIVAVGAAVAAHQDRAEIIGLHILWRDAAQVGLHQLADLLLQGHAGKQVGDHRAIFRRDCHRIFVGWPDFRIGYTLAGHFGWLRLGLCQAGGQAFIRCRSACRNRKRQADRAADPCPVQHCPSPCAFCDAMLNVSGIIS